MSWSYMTVLKAQLHESPSLNLIQQDEDTFSWFPA